MAGAKSLTWQLFLIPPFLPWIYTPEHKSISKMCPYTLLTHKALGFSLIFQGHGLELSHQASLSRTLQDLSLALLLSGLIGHLKARSLLLRRWAAAVPPSNDDDTGHCEKLCFESLECDSAMLREHLLSHTWGLPEAGGLDGARGGGCWL